MFAAILGRSFSGSIPAHRRENRSGPKTVTTVSVERRPWERRAMRCQHGGVARIAYEDLEPGSVFDLGKVEIDRADMLDFARRFDPQPFHVDEDAAKASIFGGLCASGWYTASLWMRAYVDHVLADSTSQGSPGGRELSWLAPVFPGDILRFGMEVTGRRRSRRRPELGLVDIAGTADRGTERVLRFHFTGIFSSRERD